ncbi:hypothetical protein [Methylobacillus sp.]|uniref:hypothetical protein n=1 Tax=Methylobacillus sp. TaxID=56818 RepID=UPI0012CA5D84|nr:hypothetical protein [Methylobacillus sp.]MPS48505.1 hypothetical protein [Methylobacillus sp.]
MNVMQIDDIANVGDLKRALANYPDDLPVSVAHEFWVKAGVQLTLKIGGDSELPRHLVIDAGPIR